MMHYAWVDLETTGLDENEESILEFAIMFTDDQGNKKALDNVKALLPGFRVEDGVASIVLAAPPEKMERLVERVREMHDRTGLSRDSLASNVTPKEVESRVAALIDAMGFNSQTLTIAGNTVHFDLRFLKRHMPAITSRMHYRILDMSAVALFADTKGLPRPPKAEAHRAAADIKESLEYFKYYRKHLVVVQADGK